MQATERKTAYPGCELALFERATNWKAHWLGFVRPYVGGRVAEVGAGIGATTSALCSGREREWLCLEPDANLAGEIDRRIACGELTRNCRVMRSGLADLSDEARFDTILYIDVLEHIEDDRREIAEAVRRLATGGCLVVLAPAHPWLYSPFDAAVGHVRRYTLDSLQRLMPAGLARRRAVYLDSVGMLLLLGNRLLLKRAVPTDRQIAVWNRCVIPLSRVVDGLLRYRLGKSVLGVWQKVAG